MTQSVKKIVMENFGEKIRRLREEKGLPLRTVADFLGIDQAILSKIERGHRKANKELIAKLASFFCLPPKELLTVWLSDKMVNEIANEEVGLEALKMAEDMVQYQMDTKINTQSIIKMMQPVLQKDKRVAAAWLFGSFARGEQKPDSDIDVMVEMVSGKKISMFDLLDIAFVLEKTTKKKIDLVEKGYLKEFALNTAIKDMIKIYG